MPLPSLPITTRILSFFCLGLALASGAEDAHWRHLEAPGFPDLFEWSDWCNVYAIRDGDAALLINFGDGSGIEHLTDIGVKQVEWVLFTDHHREECQGAVNLSEKGIKTAAPEAERSLFERPATYRQMKPRLGDGFTVHGASYVRPPIRPIPIDRVFSRMDTFSWRGHEVLCVDTRGNSPGGMSYLLRSPYGSWIAFTGDLMRDGARMNTYFDTEWDYSFAAGIYALGNSASQIAGYRPKLLLPSHGAVVSDAAKQLAVYEQKLRGLAAAVVRGYDIFRFAEAGQDRVSTPTAVPFVWQITPHLYKFRGPNFFANFVMLLADSGHALVIDCGLFDEKFLDNSIERMRTELGLKHIDAVLITHMHGDHFLEAPHLRERWGAQIWALDRMAPQIEHPERFDLAAAIPAYGKGFDAIRLDRILESGEVIEWEGYKLTADWMPGQTEFAMGLNGVIDGKKVVFTGDNIFADPSAPQETGHEAIVARNSGILEDGYIEGAELLTRLEPDLLVGGHSYVMDHPAALIQRYRDWAYGIREIFRGLSPDEEYRYWFDPFWVRADPYRSIVHPGATTQIQLEVRNFRSRPQKHSITIHTPPGLSAEPSVVEGTLALGTRGAFPVTIKAAPDARAGTAIVAFDITMDGERRGELFDAIVSVEP